MAVILDEAGNNILDESLGTILDEAVITYAVSAYTTIEFNVLVPVTLDIDFWWNIGQPQNTHIRQLAQERIDFIY